MEPVHVVSDHENTGTVADKDASVEVANGPQLFGSFAMKENGKAEKNLVIQITKLRINFQSSN